MRSSRVVKHPRSAEDLEAAVDDTGLAVNRIVVNKVTIRDRPDTPEPFSTGRVGALPRRTGYVDGRDALSFTREGSESATAPCSQVSMTA
jgi:hypothetical protein